MYYKVRLCGSNVSAEFNDQCDAVKFVDLMLECGVEEDGGEKKPVRMIVEVCEDDE